MWLVGSGVGEGGRGVVGRKQTQCIDALGYMDKSFCKRGSG